MKRLADAAAPDRWLASFLCFVIHGDRLARQPLEECLSLEVAKRRYGFQISFSVRLGIAEGDVDVKTSRRHEHGEPGLRSAHHKLAATPKNGSLQSGRVETETGTEPDNTPRRAPLVLNPATSVSNSHKPLAIRLRSCQWSVGCEPFALDKTQRRGHAKEGPPLPPHRTAPHPHSTHLSSMIKKQVVFIPLSVEIHGMSHEFSVCF